MIHENELFSGFPFDEGASADVIHSAESALGVNLPSDYVEFLGRSNGGEGFIGGSYLVLWKAEELKPFNDDYGADVYAPGLLLFGSDGAGEAYAFDTNSNKWTIVQVPFIGMDLRYAVNLCNNFSEFLQHLYKLK
jgi:cell wall assembly regulator SMI1